jgi:hypothetical protein
MNEEKMDEMIRDLARDFNSPPPTPREEMWAAIQAAREDEKVIPLSRWRRDRIAWGVGIAAVLMVGIGLGRLSVRPEGAAVAPVAVEETMPAPLVGSESGETAYRVVTTQHLGQAEMLLTSFRAEARAGEIDARVGVWAVDLLSTTRLLLDSPAGDDPELKALLEDLELVLVQLSHLPPNERTQEARQEVEMVTDAIEEGGVLPKIRTALQGGTPPALNEEEL